MADPRDDVYILAALLADIDRVLHPLPRGMRGKVRPEPNFPPPLPTPAGPAAGPAPGRGGSFMAGGSPSRGSSLAPRHARAALPAHEKTAPPSPRPHGHDAPASRPAAARDQDAVVVEDTPRGRHAGPATFEQGSQSNLTQSSLAQSSPATGLEFEPPLLRAAGFQDQPGAQPLPDATSRAKAAQPAFHAPRLPAPELPNGHARTWPEQVAPTTEPDPHLPDTLTTRTPPRLRPPRPEPLEQAMDGDTPVRKLDPPAAQHAPSRSKPPARPEIATRPENRPRPPRHAPPVRPDATRVFDNTSTSHPHHGEPPVVAAAAKPAPAAADDAPLAAAPAAGADASPRSEEASARPGLAAAHGRLEAAAEHLGRHAPARPENQPRRRHHTHDPSAWIAHGLKEPAVIRDEHPDRAAATGAGNHPPDSTIPRPESDQTPSPIQPPEWLAMAGMDWPDEVSRVLRRAGRTWPMSRHDMRRMAGKLHVAYLDRALRRWR